MPDNLVIRLARGDAQLATAVSVSEQVSPIVREGPLSDLRPADGERVVVLAPATTVLLTTANLPVRGKARMLQAIPYALEEHLAVDVGKLHFALGGKDTDNHVAVAVAARSEIEALQQRLADAGLQVDAIVAEQHFVPVNEGAATVVLIGEDALLRNADGSTLGCSCVELASFIQLLNGTGGGTGESADRDDDVKTRVIVHAAEDQRSLHEPCIEQLQAAGLDVEVEWHSDNTLRVLAQNSKDGSAINLLQGDFAPRTVIDELWRPWRTAAMLLIAFAATLLGVRSIQLLQLQAEESELDARIQQVLLEACPSERAIVDPRLQMQRCVEAALGGDGGNEEVFLTTLSAVSATLSANTRIEALSFRSRVLDMKLTAPDVEALDRMKRQLAERNGLVMNIESANPRDGAVEGQVEIRGPGA